MKYGLAPLLIDVRDWHLHDTVGSVSTDQFPDELDHDAGLAFPVQQYADERCVGITVTDIAADYLGRLFSADYNQMQTLRLENVAIDHPGVNPRDGFKIPISLGLLPKELEPVNTEHEGVHTALDPVYWPSALDAQASQNRLRAFLRVDTGPHDIFDNIRASFLVGAKSTAAIASGWYSEWEYETPSSGILLENPKAYSGDHMYKVCGWTMHDTRGNLIRGYEPFLKVKTWNDRGWGDNGYGYLSRDAVNRRFNQLTDPHTWGSIALAFDELPTTTVAQLQNQKSELIEVLLAFLQNQLIKLIH